MSLVDTQILFPLLPTLVQVLPLKHKIQLIINLHLKVKTVKTLLSTDSAPMFSSHGNKTWIDDQIFFFETATDPNI